MKPVMIRDIRLRPGLFLFGGVLILLLALPGAIVGLPFLEAAGGTTMICTNGPTFDLVADEGYIDTPDGNSIYMWGFADANGAIGFQMPGPILCVDEGETVTVNLTNNLLEPTSIIFPGQEDVLAGGSPVQPEFDASNNLVSLVDTAAASGGTIQYSFVASEPGTYLYESGTNQHKRPGGPAGAAS